MCAVVTWAAASQDGSERELGQWVGDSHPPQLSLRLTPGRAASCFRSSAPDGAAEFRYPPVGGCSTHVEAGNSSIQQCLS